MSKPPLHAPIPPPDHPTYDLRKVVRDALEEDAGDRGDITTLSTIPDGAIAEATFLAKAEGVLAGIGLTDMIFEIVDPNLQVSWSMKDGDAVSPGVEFGTVRGSARSILVAERIALNFMQRMSGIATATRAMVEAAAAGGGGAKVLETRKTAPGLRLVDKWAVLIGGGHNHRMGLYDMFMIKDNHVAAAGGIAAAVARVDEYISKHGLQGTPVEVETRTLEEVDEIIEIISSGRSKVVTRIMLDNMAKSDSSKPGGVDVSILKAAVAKIKDNPAVASVETEASGNVTLDSVGVVSSTGVTYVSVGALTHSVKALDISLKIVTR